MNSRIICLSVSGSLSYPPARRRRRSVECSSFMASRLAKRRIPAGGTSVVDMLHLPDDIAELVPDLSELPAQVQQVPVGPVERLVRGSAEIDDQLLNVPHRPRVRRYSDQAGPQEAGQLGQGGHPFGPGRRVESSDRVLDVLPDIRNDPQFGLPVAVELSEGVVDLLKLVVVVDSGSQSFAQLPDRRNARGQSLKPCQGAVG